MRFVVLFLLATLAAADLAWWSFDAWDGLSCGNAPQNGQVFFTTQGMGDQLCIDFGTGQMAYSYASSYSEENVEVRGYLHEHCEGSSKVLQNNTCTNPDIEIPYIRSWSIYSTDE
ncbi:hypothetical protein N7533_003719 [Penicillium manginii]|jgi:hypothetical protein|uniref:uncharacterized protein n=1 Tax=Penicillium manginii TaxID=203109 RepID=UPI0025469F54|nr:uncharacterized protein N7533_003719 [Penicillium manginii]KAJ5761680.1 hypothetical protein N7533_003719 [Penicillium manginii]